MSFPSNEFSGDEFAEKPYSMCNDLLTAPKVTNTRRKIIWSDEGIEAYRDEEDEPF